jgi:uncharacterized membrane protein YdjX (TVP38/TMEM64 family)
MDSPLKTRAIVSALLIVALVVLVSSESVHDALLTAFAASDRLIAQHAVAGAMVFVLLSALSAMLAFFSSAVLVPPAVHAWGPVFTALLLWLGWILGGVIAYTLARVLGRPVVERLASAKSLAQLDRRLTERTPFGVVLLIQLAFPSEIPGYLLGLVRYPLSRYLAALAIAELPYAIGTVLLGEGFVERRVGLLAIVGVIAIVAAVVLTRALRRRLPSSDRG